MDCGLVAALELVPTLFDGEKTGESGESGESGEYSEMPMLLKEVSSSNGGGRVARPERAIANVIFFSLFVTRRESGFYSRRGFPSRPTEEGLLLGGLF